MADERDPAERVRKLVQFAGQVEVDNSIAPKKYFRSGVEMERMAKIYHDEGNLESAFILYSKFITLFVEKLPAHPEYAKTAPVDKATNKKSLRRVFSMAEELKGILKERYQQEYQQFIAEEARKKEEEEARRKEFERREAEERARREQEAQKIAQHQSSVSTHHAEIPRVIPSAPPLIGDYPAPPTGRNESTVGSNQREHGAPSEQTHSTMPRPPSYSSLFSVPTPSTPSVDRSTKPVMAADTTPHGLRKVHIPGELISHFLRLASDNTRKNLETCGILAGRLQNNMFCITHLLIPKQTSTSDSCTTLSEEELFEFQDSHNLITLGWIHTHPSQTSFMSSVDLHTHCSYQLIMPEAIAIVCSPKFSETGVFSLTPGYGLQFILNCKKPGFHPHPKEPPLYEVRLS
ncbi:STAM-binding protein-like isoform X3 [Orbicella faveolata]|uniref:STAM-binding protein-like isoform X1 n=1 Tax=Orbicella faveolata TaxID=48498 RepID=UPI0009E36250|nr:STAM-binding protein-like isoform X1 [Orbicella faveolata]XP_020612867.1 STAM-binding protein-like isoform X3 [Orbicella faveolata]